MSRIFALVDCNNFYVSCERVFDPSLRGKPVVILSNNDGCAVARSNEARELDIPFGAPWFKIQKGMSRLGVRALSSNYTLYGDMSARVMDVLASFSPHMEVYSIDEAFIVLSVPRDVLVDLGIQVRETVYRHTGIPVSVGMGPTKTLAKLGAHLAKKSPQGVVVLQGDHDDDALLSSISTEKVWGIGGQYRKRLANRGIHAALDLKRAQGPWLRRELTVTGLRLIRELNGIPSIPMEELPVTKKAMVTSRSFGKLVHTEEELMEAITDFTARCSEKLRSQGSVASNLTIFMLTDRFSSEPQHQGAASMELPVPSSDSFTLIGHALHLAKKVYRKGYGYKKAGVMCTGLVSDSTIQLNIFAPVPDRRRLMDTIDLLNKRFGRGSVSLGVSSPGASWAMKRKLLSPCYTTRWEDLPLVR